jgi:hypothetical protein
VVKFDIDANNDNEWNLDDVKKDTQKVRSVKDMEDGPGASSSPKKKSKSKSKSKS